MYTSTLLSTLALFAATGLAGYVLEDDYIQEGFFDKFSFSTGSDNQGFVAYQDQDAANKSQLISQDTTGAYLKVDSKNVTPNGRPSVKLTSNKSYQSGLIVADITHMPGGICGTWPAFWTVGPNWPAGGEIDIFEGVNDQTSNNVTLHTGSSATIVNKGQFYGQMSTSYCGPTSDNSGCQISAADPTSYGTGFNNAGGAIYAMEWTNSYINVYFFSNDNKSAIHDNAVSSAPDPSTWGQPLASFSGDFDLATAFVNQQIVINTNFCGTWAGSVWNSTSCHSEKYPTCQSYVENHPTAFAEAYWQFAALKVYQDDGNVASVSSSSASAPASSSTAAAAPSSSAPVYSSTTDAAPSSSTPAPVSSSTSEATSSSSILAPVSSSTPAAAPSSSSTPSSTPSAPASAPSSFPSTSTATPPAYTPRPTRFTTMSTIVATETSIVTVTVHASSEAAQPTSASGYSPMVGSDGGVDTASEEGNFETGPDGEVEYEDRKRHARHLGVHRRRVGRV